jgi:uncharacterized protein (TIGR00369 family)
MSVPMQLTADEPVRGVIGVPVPADWSGLDFLRAFLRGDVDGGPIGRLTGMRGSEFGSGRATFVLPVTPWLQNSAAFIEPGVMALLADGSLSCAILSGLGPGKGVVTSELSVTYIQPVTRGTSKLVCRAHTLHSSKTAAVSTCEVTDAEGRLLAHGSTRCVTIDAPTAPPGSGFPARVDYEVPDPYLRPVQGDLRPPEVWNALTGMEMLHGFLEGEFGPGPISVLFGMRPTDAGDGQVSAEMAASQWHCGMGGTVYGGLLALLAQSCMESAILTTLPAGTLHATLDLSVHFIRPVLPGEGTVTAMATVDHRGRLVRVASARILDAEGRTAALARASAMVVPDGIRRMLRGEFLQAATFYQ